MTAEELERRRERERKAVRKARENGRAVSYIDDDGCEITATPTGHIFYNATDWY